MTGGQILGIISAICGLFANCLLLFILISMQKRIEAIEKATKYLLEIARD